MTNHTNKLNENRALANAITAALDTDGVHPGNDSWHTAYGRFFKELQDGASFSDALDASLDVLDIPEHDARRLLARSTFEDTLLEANALPLHGRRARSRVRPNRDAHSQPSLRWSWGMGAILGGVVFFFIGLVLVGIINLFVGWAPDALKVIIDAIFFIGLVAVGIFVGGSWGLKQANKHHVTA